MDLNYNILIVDDIVENIQVAMNILKEDNYSFSFAKNGEDALVLLQDNEFDLVLLDIMMPKVDGFSVIKKMKADPKLADIPVIFLTAKVDSDAVTEGLKLGAVDYITKPVNAEELLVRVRHHLELYQAKKLLEANNITLQTKIKYEAERLVGEIETAQQDILGVLMEVVEALSDETGAHIKRIANISRFLAQKDPSLSEEDEELIYLTSPMHDIGKLFVPESILHKPGKLTEEEFEVVQMHTTKAHKFFRFSKRKIIKIAETIATQHHEKFNGKGYPQGLKGEEIHPFARIVAIADVVDALTHKRCYKDAWSFEDAIQYVKEHSGSQFDPRFVDIFLQNSAELEKILTA